MITAICLASLSGLVSAPSIHASYTSRGEISIYGNDGFTRDNGVVSGSGTKIDPYLIEGWEVNPVDCGICVSNTNAYFIVRNVFVHSGSMYGLGGQGIELRDVSNARIENSVLPDGQSYLVVATSVGQGSYSNLAIIGNTISAGGIDVIAYSPSSISKFTISDNSVSNGGPSGISLTSVTKAMITGNTLISGGLYISGSPSQLDSYTVTPDNFVNGRPIVYRKGCADATFSGSSYGELILANCRNIQVAEIDMSNSVSAIELVQVNGGSITKSRFINTTQSVRIVNSANIAISGNNLSSPALSHMHTIDVSSSVLISVTNNTISGGGLRFLETNSSTIYDNTVSGSIGIQASGSNIRITNNLLLGSGGISLGNGYTANIDITGNVVSGSYVTASGYNYYPVGSGISAGYPPYGPFNNITISGNNLSYDNLGIHLIDTTNVTINSNNISYNNGGVIIEYTYISPDKAAIRVYHNNFISNGGNQGSGYAKWDNGYPSGGNYWSDYAGIDNCSGFYQNLCPSPDGIGDTVRGVVGGTADDYPLMNPYGPPDSTKPSWSAGAELSFIDVSMTQVTLEWPPATDDTWVQSYRVFQDGRVLASVPGGTISYRVSDLRPGARYNFTVEAGDAWDNWSIEALSAMVVTISGPSPTLPPGSGAASNPLGFLQEYWYFIGGVAVCCSALSVFLAFRGRSSRRSGLREVKS